MIMLVFFQHRNLLEMFLLKTPFKNLTVTMGRLVNILMDQIYITIENITNF